MYDIYSQCPEFSTEVITLRLTSDEDTEELLKCYYNKGNQERKGENFSTSIQGICIFGSV